MPCIAIYAPTLLQLSPFKPVRRPLAGAELSMLNLRRMLELQGHKVVCFTNLYGPAADFSLRNFIDFREQGFELVIYSRTYGQKLGVRGTNTRRVLWLHDTVDEAAYLVDGGIGALGKLLGQYDHFVFVSAWQRLQYQSCFPNGIAWSEKSTSVWHFLPEVTAQRNEGRIFDVIHTAHPRKALAAVLEIYDLLLEMRPTLRLALVDASEIYQDDHFFYKGRLTTLSAVLKTRYGGTGPPFTVLNAMSQYELIRLLAKCEVFLHPDQSTETGATTLLEAIRAGCATVVSDLGCLPEMASAVGSVLPMPGKVEMKTYANAALKVLDRYGAHRTCDVGRNIREHNAVQQARWASVLAATSRELRAPRLAICNDYCDFNGLLAEHPRNQILFLAFPRLPNCRFSVHLFPTRGMALLGVLEPTRLPAIEGDVDALADAIFDAMKALLEQLSALGILRLVMRISSAPPISTFLAAWLSASTSHGARIMTIRQLVISLHMAQQDELRERQSMSTRVRQQVAAARKAWVIRRLSRSDDELDQWFSAYSKHRRGFGAVGLVQKHVRELLNSEGELGIHGALAIDPSNDEVCGFYLILRVGDFATLHSWGTERRYQSNLHKLLIADAACLARAYNVKCFEYGSDLSEYGQSVGLNSLYRRFGGDTYPCFQLTFSVPSVCTHYSPI